MMDHHRTRAIVLNAVADVSKVRLAHSNSRPISGSAPSPYLGNGGGDELGAVEGPPVHAAFGLQVTGVQRAVGGQQLPLRRHVSESQPAFSRRLAYRGATGADGSPSDLLQRSSRVPEGSGGMKAFNTSRRSA